LIDLENALIRKPLCRLYFHLSNARHSKTFYDIVFVIDAYRLFQLMTPEMPCIHSGRLSSRERVIGAAAAKVLFLNHEK
jgi:hypothetical protein